ncbi:nuclease-related domain-containing protein [Luteolibacter soli]|uniref:Nuclease-related domain-containing protein n=1 Tax=Luteolibacter soli TaxID=3135280 RepID=A0ABU9AXE0_9BACT
MNLHLGMFVGVGVMAGGLYFLHREIDRIFAEEKRRSRAPFKEKLLRPPGESLRLKIEELHDEFMEQGLVLAVTTACTGGAIMVFTFQAWWMNGIVWTIISAIGFACGRHRWNKLKGLRKTLRNYRLGFDGERYVAEKLSELIGQGYRVFHDFLFDMKPGGDATNFNIDHIVVGPAGVFVLETKTYRQPNGELPEGDERHKVRGDGDALLLPGGHRQRKPLKQVRKNADELSKFLTGTSPSRVPVYPIIAMPGWYTEEEAFPDLLVLNPLRISARISRFSQSDVLPPSEVRMIADRIEAHCRNVDSA